MASGRHGAYRDSKFTEREAEYAAVQKKTFNEGGDEDWSSNADPEHERHPKRICDSLVYHSGVRERNINGKLVVNGSKYHSNSGRTDLGGFYGAERRNGTHHMMDREPGELSSDDDQQETQGNGDIVGTKLEDGKKSSPVQIKKRKFSPIVWDRDDKVVRTAVRRLNKIETENLAPSPALVESYHRSPSPLVRSDGKRSSSLIEDKVNMSEKSPIEQGVRPDPSESCAVISYLQVAEERYSERSGALAAGDGEYLPERTIISSRWASDSYSPLDEGEISDYDGVHKSKGKSTFESAEVRDQKKLISPQLVEIKIRREGSEGLGGRSSESDGRGMSSTRQNPLDGDGNSENLEIDGKNDYARRSISGSDTESKDDDNSHATPELSEPPPRTVNMLKGCRNVDEFERLNKIDEGTYGVVFRARDKKTGEIVALKKVKMEREREGFPLTALREINILLSFDHPSIVDVKEVVVGNSLDSIFMVMEYMEHDLKALMETMKQPFSQSEVKCLMLQLLEGVKYLHDNWVLHRDLKTSNILLNNRGELKICDFGLARQYGSPLKPYTQLVVTLWYRAPELLLKAKEYSTAIDMWSLGCIMAELLSKEPLFNGKTEFDQLDKIYRILGTPNEKIWPGFSKLPGMKVNYVKHPYNLLRRKFPATSFTGSPVLSDAGFDLLNKLLTYDPEKRISAEAALKHEWFREVPLPKSKEFMPTFPAQHAQDRRTQRFMKSPDPLEEQRRKELQQGESGAGGLFGQ